MMEWININDEMPEYDTPVIICANGMNGNVIMEATYSEIINQFTRQCLTLEHYGASKWITHWMPLPEPPC